jgi:hypothetical protein
MRTARFPRGSDDAHLLIGRLGGELWRRENKTHAYVEIPPALIITDSDGAVFSLGTEYNVHMEFNVLRNDVDTGEFASRITYDGKLVRIFGKSGWKSFSRNRRHFI